MKSIPVLAQGGRVDAGLRAQRAYQRVPAIDLPSPTGALIDRRRMCHVGIRATPPARHCHVHLESSPKYADFERFARPQAREARRCRARESGCVLLRVLAEEAFSVRRERSTQRPCISQMSLDSPRHISEPHWCRVSRPSEADHRILRFSVGDFVERDPAVREHELEMHVDTHLRELHQEGPDAVFGVPRLGQGALFQRSYRALAVCRDEVVATAVRLNRLCSPRCGRGSGHSFEEF